MVLLEKFLCEIITPKGKPAIHQFFTGLTDGYSAYMLEQGIHVIYELAGHEKPESFATVNGILFGITLAKSITNPQVKLAIEGFLEMKAREKGENVFDIFHQKAKKL